MRVALKVKTFLGGQVRQPGEIVDVPMAAGDMMVARRQAVAVDKDGRPLITPTSAPTPNTNR